MLLRKPHQAALAADKTSVYIVELFDQGIYAHRVEPQRPHLDDNFRLKLLIPAFLGGRERRVVQFVVDGLVLEAAEALEAVGDLVKGRQYRGLQLGLDRGERQRAGDVIVLDIAFDIRVTIWLRAIAPAWRH